MATLYRTSLANEHGLFFNDVDFFPCRKSSQGNFAARNRRRLQVWRCSLATPTRHVSWKFESEVRRGSARASESYRNRAPWGFWSQTSPGVRLTRVPPLLDFHICPLRPRNVTLRIDASLFPRAMCVDSGGGKPARFHSDVGEKTAVCSTAWPKFDSSWHTLHCSCCVMCRLCQDLASTRFRAHAWRRLGCLTVQGVFKVVTSNGAVVLTSMADDRGNALKFLDVLRHQAHGPSARCFLSSLRHRVLRPI